MRVLKTAGLDWYILAQFKQLTILSPTKLNHTMVSWKSTFHAKVQELLRENILPFLLHRLPNDPWISLDLCQLYSSHSSEESWERAVWKIGDKSQLQLSLDLLPSLKCPILPLPCPLTTLAALMPQPPLPSVLQQWLGAPVIHMDDCQPCARNSIVCIVASAVLMERTADRTLVLSKEGTPLI